MSIRPILRDRKTKTMSDLSYKSFSSSFVTIICNIIIFSIIFIFKDKINKKAKKKKIVSLVFIFYGDIPDNNYIPQAYKNPLQYIIKNLI